jgi:two-component system, sensor histidine kinase and response regulator
MSSNIPRVLVVEDDTHLLNGIVDVLEGAGIHVLRAGNGHEALDVLAESAPPPGVIVSDIGMPYMDGYELLEAVRHKHEWLEIPFIFLTAYTGDQEVRRGMIAGVDDYLTKPFTPDTLIDAIHAKLRRQSRLAIARAAQISRMKRDILGIFHHEFRTPLTPMVAYSELLTRDTDGLSPQELREFVHGIQQGTTQLRRLIEDFILLVELESGESREEYLARKLPIDDLGRFLEIARLTCADLAAEKEIMLQIHMPERVPIFEGEPAYIQSAISQLVQNAIKFTDRAGGVVRVSVEADDQHVIIHVGDEGRGIPEGEQDKIFDPFYQVDRERYEDQGTGSGLAIVRGIMALHGGRVHVASAPGQGSIFSLYFPRSEGSEP